MSIIVLVFLIGLHDVEGMSSFASGGYQRPSGWAAAKRWPPGAKNISHEGKCIWVIPATSIQSESSHVHVPYYRPNQIDERELELKEEDGFYPCPADIVNSYNRGLNSSLEVAFANGTLSNLFAEVFNGSWTFDEATGTNSVGENGWQGMITPFDGSIESFVDQIRTHMDNYTHICYEEGGQSLLAIIFKLIIGLVLMLCVLTAVYFACLESLYLWLRRKYQNRQDRQEDMADKRLEAAAEDEPPIPVKIYRRVTSGALMPIPMPNINPLNENSFFYGYFQSLSTILQTFLATFIPNTATNGSDVRPDVQYTPVHIQT